MPKPFGIAAVPLSLLAALGPTVIEAQDTVGVGVIQGILLAADPTQPSQAEICIAASDRCTAADSDGRFTLVDLRPGSYRLEVSSPGSPGLTTDPIEVRAGLSARIEVQLPVLNTVERTVAVNKTALIPLEEIKTSGVLIQQREIFKIPGNLQDVSRYVTSLPGVSSPPARTL